MNYDLKDEDVREVEWEWFWGALIINQFWLSEGHRAGVEKESAGRER